MHFGTVSKPNIAFYGSFFKPNIRKTELLVLETRTMTKPAKERVSGSENKIALSCTEMQAGTG